MSLTAEEFTAHIHRISELSGDNEEVMNLLNDIQQDRTEPQFTEVDVFDKDGKRFSEKYGDGVVKTKVAGRGWTHWLQLPWLDYNDGVETECGCECPCCKEKCKKKQTI